MLSLPASSSADELPDLTVIGVAPDGTESPVTAYRWLVELDKTYHVQTLPGGAADPTTFDPNWDQGNDGHPGGETLSVGFHQSYMPVVAKGCRRLRRCGLQRGSGPARSAGPADVAAEHALLRLRGAEIRCFDWRRLVCDGRIGRGPAHHRLCQ